MTNDTAFEMLKRRLPGDDSDLKNVSARELLDAAVNHMNMLGEYRWNQQYVTATLTSGTSKYFLYDLVPDWQIRKIFDEKLWFVDSQHSIEIVSREQFNYRARGVTSTGKPNIAVIHSNETMIEFYPTPDDAYEIWAMAGILITNIAQLPVELHLPVIALATIFGAKADSPEYAQAADIWKLTVASLENTREYTVWQGDTITPDSYGMGLDVKVGRAADSTNIVGEL